MGKIWNAFRYGNRKTRFYILIIFLLFIISIACFITAVMTKALLWGLGMIFSLILGIIIMQSLSFKGSGQYTSERKEIIKKEKKKRKKSNNKSDNIESDESNKEKPRSSKTKNESGKNENETEEEDDSGYLAELEASEIKNLLVAYKVKKDHYPVMIDSCKSEHIRQCPAYMWSEKGYLQFLLLEKKPRTFRIPLTSVNKITYTPAVSVRKFLEYEEFQKPSFAGLTFGSLLPSYYEDSTSGIALTKKNLYMIEPDIVLTNTSIRAVIDLLQLDVTIHDKITKSSGYSNYFKEAYKTNILWKDGVISTKELKAEIKIMLQKMAEAEISNLTFNENIYQMVQGRLITKEYADYYLDYRQKNKKKTELKNTKKR